MRFLVFLGIALSVASTQASAQFPDGIGDVESYSICKGRDTIYDSYRGTFDYYADYLSKPPLARLEYAQFELQEVSKVKMVNVLNDLYAVSHRKIDPHSFNVEHDSPTISVEDQAWYAEVGELRKALGKTNSCSTDSTLYEGPMEVKCNHLEHLRAYLRNSPINRIRFLTDLMSRKDVPDELFLLIATDLDVVMGCNTAKYRQHVEHDDAEKKWLARSIRAWRRKCR